jgi:hypothetical protein
MQPGRPMRSTEDCRTLRAPSGDDQATHLRGGAGGLGRGNGGYSQRGPDITAIPLPDTDAVGTGVRGFANTPAGLRGAAASLQPHLEPGHRSLGCAVGNQLRHFLDG